MLSPDLETSDFGPWRTEDAVTGPAKIRYVDQDGDPVDVTGYTPGGGRLVDPAGVAVPVVVTIAGTAPDTYLEVTLPGTEFDVPGIWAIDVQLAAPGGTFRPAPLQVVVEEEFTGWWTVRGIRQVWRDAPANHVTLYRLLELAKLQVTTYAHEVAVPLTPVAGHLADAQAAQAQNLWNLNKTDPTSFGIGDEPFVIRPHPLDWTIKAMIRPKSPKPVVA